MSKHRYSTTILIFILLLIMISSAVALFESEDIDEVCSTNNAVLRRINGQWNCSTTHYGEVYYHSESDALVLDITSQNNYTQLTGYNISNVQGMSVTNSEFTIAKNTTYMIDSTFSFTGGANSTYHCAMFLNGVEQEDCEFQRTMGGGTAIEVSTITCLKSGLIDATIDVRCKDTNNPVADMNFYALNINIVEVQ